MKGIKRGREKEREIRKRYRRLKGNRRKRRREEKKS
jgi:hypothetical protein